MTSDVAGAGETPYGAVSLAIAAYFQKVNQEDSGVCGRQIVLTVEDDEYLGELALAQTQKLVTEDNVLAVIGALNTKAHGDVAAYLNDPDGDGDTADGVPDLFVSTGWSGWGDIATYPWTTAFLPDYRSDGRVLAAYIAANLPDKQIGLLYRNDEFGQDYLTAMEEAFGAAGNLFSQPYPVDDEDVSQEISAVVDAGAEVIVLASGPPVTASAIVSARGGGFDQQFLLSYVNQPSNLASELGGGVEAEAIIAGFEQLDGVLTTAYLLSAVEDEDNVAVVEHVRIMEAYGGPPASNLSIYGQALAETVVQTLERACPDLTRSEVMAAAESLDGFHPSLLLPGINVVLGEDDHVAIQAMQVERINADGTMDSLGDPIDVGP
ncbi:MAG: ABC transporter substrate-binding protein [Chloroflexi bacterium]|nr:ABC transporter substrate-binding protein [Chloroflexota bacterium]